MSSDPVRAAAPLSAGEGRRLTELECQLEAQDPMLARAVRTGQPEGCNGDLGGIGHLIVAIAVALLVLPLLYIVAVGAVLYIVAAFTGWLLKRVLRAQGRSNSSRPRPATT
jgi:hypothetical protein